MNGDLPRETDGREDYYNAALVSITLICDRCGATLDPDEDLGPNVSFESDGYYILLGERQGTTSKRSALHVPKG